MFALKASRGSVTLSELFKAKVAQFPGASALRFGSEEMSYRELDLRAEQIARYLRSRGIVPEARVGLFVERSADMVVGLLGIIKAGAAYVPLDLEYPRERLRFMIADAELSCILTAEPFVKRLPPTEVDTICLDRDRVRIEAAPNSEACHEARVENLAYVIYTSGSTGTPKGVAVTHQAVARLACDTDYITLSAGDRVAQSSSSSFDAAIFEIWGALLNGCCLVGLAREVLLSPPDLVAMLEAEEINHLFVTTALFNQIAREAPETFSTVDTVLFGGEAVNLEAVRRVVETGFPGLLLHLYGPAENTTFSTCHRVTLDSLQGTTVAIGRPITMSVSYVLDERSEIVTAGQTGELYLGGGGLARGYLRRPRRTAERFLPSPFGSAGTRLYRSGDLVRQRSDDELEFVGRRDHQVKIRGFRVELGEIEARLAAHPSMRDCVVVSDESGDTSSGEPRRLVAFCRLKNNSSVTVEDLQGFLADQIPAYMVPQAFELLTELPVGPIGKVDRTALARRAPSVRRISTRLVAPQTPAEELLATTYGDVLGLDQVSINDSFLGLGGNSLSAMRVVARVREASGVNLPLTSLFETPTIAELANRLVEQRVNDDAILPVSRQQLLALSFDQQRMWFLDQLESGTAVYNIPWVMCLRGRLSVDALQASLNRIESRHEILRTSYQIRAGRPVQKVRPAAVRRLPLVDLRAVDKARRPLLARGLAQQETRRSFDLEAGPVWRWQLIQIDDLEHLLVITMHHIASDRWSLDILNDELSRLYQANVEGFEALLPPLPIQYADFAAWQHERLTPDVLAEELDYWRGRLPGSQPVLDLPTDRPRSTARAFRGARRSYLWPSELREQLQGLTRRYDVTLFMVLLAALKSLFYRYSGQSDVIVGSSIANRDRKETEGLVGFFVNTLVLRSDLSGEPSFDTVMQRVREAALGAFAHQIVPFEQVVEDLQPERASGQSPFFQVMFDQIDDPVVLPDLHGLDVSPVDVDLGVAQFELTLWAADRVEELLWLVEYNTDLYDATTIERFFGHLHTLVQRLALAPGQAISRQDYLSDAEKDQLISTWNETTGPYPREATLGALFAAQVERTPKTTAVVFDGDGLTYRELDRKANRLAHALRGSGADAGSRIGVLIERSPEMLVGILGIIKAGGAYVPLDPEYPTERLQFMVADSGIEILVTNESLLDRLPGFEGVAVCFDRDEELMATMSADAPSIDSQPQSLAYVIYTSGSTGTPKGVAVPHRAVARLVLGADYVQPSFGDRIAQVSNVSFDAATWEIWGALLNGGSLVIVPREQLLSPGSLADCLRRESITHLFLTTALFNQLVLSHPGALSPLEAVLFGGEAVDPEVVRQVLANGPPGRLLHVYGPTENTTFSTAHEVTDVGPNAPTVAIGKPIANSTAYVLDRQLQLVPHGVPDQLYLGGDGLAQGYLKRPRATSEGFVPSPFGPAGARVYGTGDVVRQTAEGDVEFRGRRDHQVKIRGFRIELGEIEAVLAAHPSVRGCVAVVQARESAHDSLQAAREQRLVAFVSTEPAVDSSASEFKSFLSQRLPAYLVPQGIIILDQLPLGPTGKVDRLALSRLEVQVAADDTDGSEPMTASEEILAGIWAEVLGVERVGRLDNFFDLGGHSLLATQIVSRMDRAFGQKISLRSLFDAATVAELAELLRAESGAGAELPQIGLASRTSDVPLSYAQQRLWFLDRFETGSSAYNVPFAVRLLGPLVVPALKASLMTIVARHEVLRTSYPALEGKPKQFIHEPQGLLLSEVDLLGVEPGQQCYELEAHLAEEAQRPFNLSTGPVLRAALVQLGVGEHVLAVSMHHIVADRWSVGLLSRELESLYSFYLDGRAASTFPLMPLPIQYADFAVWQRRQEGSQLFDDQLSYWRECLEAAPPILELPADRPRPATRSYRGKHLPCRFSGSLLAGVRALARATDSTLFMTLLACFKTLLARLTGTTDILVGTPIANRQAIETEGLIGFFLNTLVLRSDVSAGSTFVELLRHVRETALAAYGHQDIPFEQLVEALAPERSLSSEPFFQVMFAQGDGQAWEGLSLERLSCEPVEVKIATAKFDLTLWLDAVEDDLVGMLEYSVELFDTTTVARWTGHLKGLLESVVADSETPITELSLLRASERQQLLREWSGGSASDTGWANVIEIFRARASASGTMPAVALGSVTLTYSELDRRSERIAQHLRGYGIGLDMTVGLFAERSVELIAAVLGILKAGAAYLPLDPAYPRERVAFMLQDSGAPVVLSQGRLADRLPSSTAQTVVLEGLWDEDVGGGQGLPSWRVTPQPSNDGLAYVIYTSGSTGRPKGVAMSHGVLTNLIDWQLRRTIEPEAAVLQFAPSSFDVFFQELFSTWAGGGCLVLIDEDLRRDPIALWKLITERDVGRLFLPPVALQSLAEVWEPEIVEKPCLRQIFTAGEQLRLTPALRQLLSELDNCELENQYGPSESHVVTAATLSGDSAAWPEFPPIGQPIDGSRIRLLDSTLQPMPIGIPGELLIGGCAVSRGYLHRPRLTAAKVIPDPFVVGGRLYRSGDLARYRSDGVIEFLGRVDQQLKIRGFRIEPGEVEAILALHSAVKKCVVTAHDGALVAYVVADPSLPPTAELRRYLAEELPDYMIPAIFVPLDSLPLTPSGKVDRRALPVPDGLAVRSGVPAGLPRTSIEEVVAVTWSDVLATEDVGLDEDFFDLGGHSLLATRVASRLGRIFGVDVPVRVLFEAPTVAGIAAWIEEARRSGGARLPTLTRLEDRSGALPLSFAESRQWLLDQLDPGSPHYTLVPFANLLTGPLDVSALRASLKELVKRHAVLRTRFPESDGEPFRAIAEDIDGLLPVVSLEGLSGKRRDLEMDHLVHRELERGFDLVAGPVLRTLLIRLRPDLHGLLVLVHHIVADGESLRILRRELASSYRAKITGGKADLPSLLVDYVDFAHWQRGWLTDEIAESQLAYWRRQLRDMPPRLELPTDRPRGLSRGKFRGADLSVGWPRELFGRLQRFNRSADTTLFMMLLGAFQVILARYTDRRDIPVGTAVARRPVPEVEGLVGFFINSVVLRSILAGEVSFRGFLSQVRETALAAYEHQALPFDRLVEDLAPSRGPGDSPLFQVMFGFEQNPAAGLCLEGLEVAPISIRSRSSKVDLTLVMTVHEEGLKATVEYRTGLFDEVTIRRLVAHLRIFLESAIQTPDGALTDFDWLTDAERQQLVVEANDASWSSPLTTNIPELFVAQVAYRPQAVALVFGQQSLTYAELDRRSELVAGLLCRRAVLSGDIVGIRVERSPEMVIGLLGILKAGAAYLPLDLADPEERLQFLLADADVDLLLSREHRLAQDQELFSHLGVEVLSMDAPEPSADEVAVEPRSSSPEELAYVIYTSGSTGRPKGVAVTHRGVTRLVRDPNYVRLGPGDRIAQAASSAFDAATFEIWGALLNGGCLVGFSRQLLLSPMPLVSSLRDQRISRLFLTTALFNQLVREVPDGLASVTTVLFGGEAVDPHPVRRLQAVGPPSRLLHVYGPTENTTFSTYHEVTAVAETAATIAIGDPISGTSCHVLDRQMRNLPLGLPGELYLGGAGLARGYFNRPSRSAASFVPSPFGTAGERVYRTGDTVRRGRNGTIVFIGRRDHQVKIRGFRIELGEVETQLAAHPDIEECAVLVPVDSLHGEATRLKAFVSPVTLPGPDDKALRDFLKQRLPAYMIPEVFITLETLPLTANGKIDRAALGKAAPIEAAAVSVDASCGFGRPMTATQEVLAGIWRELLGAASIDLDDDFFELGGHSLLATRLISRVREVFGVEVPLRDLFESSGLAMFAESVDEMASETRALEVPPITPLREADRVRGALSFAQQRLWFLDRLEPDTSLYNLPCVVSLEGQLDKAALQASLTEILARHDVLRACFPAVGEQPVQVIASRAELPLQHEDLTRLPAEQRRLQAQRSVQGEAQRLFDLSSGPVVRARLIRLADTEHILIVTSHHIVSDGWSVAVLLDEMSVLYEAVSQRKSSPLPALSIQYPDYVHWERGWLDEAALAAQLEYWRRQLQNAPAVLELPTDRPRPTRQSLQGAVETIVWPAALQDSLRQVARRHDATLFMALLATFQVLLAKLSGQEDISVGSSLAHRRLPDLEKLIGFFVSTVVLRTEIQETVGFGQLLKQVREVALGALAHQDMPFEQLVEALKPQRSLSHSPLFQVAFSLQNVPLIDYQIPELSITQIPIATTTSKWDLLLVLMETDHGLEGAVEYAVDLFDASTIQRWCRALESLAARLVDDLERPIAHLDLLSASERRQILSAWNQTEMAYPRHATITDLFSIEAMRQPASIAMNIGSEFLSYGELARRSNQLAHRLQSLGVGAESKVGLCVERSLEMVVAMLGVLKTGAAYVPLDPGYPAERLAFMSDDAELKVVLTFAHLRHHFLKIEQTVICLDQNTKWLAENQRTLRPSQATPSNSAYVIYTSGSTGRPKGVVVSHQAVVRLVLGTDYVSLNAEDRVAQAANHSFDAATFEIWGALLAGGRLVGIPRQALLSSEGLARILTDEKISRLFLTTALFNQVASESPDAFAAVETVLFGGEAVDPRWVRHVLGNNSPNRLLHVYGPTENTTFSTWFRVTDVTAGATTVPIGGPIANSTAYVLDRYSNLVPVGVAGELHLGGEGLARGYLGRPGLTATSFVASPFEIGQRLYRTGDVVRFRGEAQLEFLGRRDHQVKIRGFRIELGEVESVLARVPGVKDCAILVNVNEAVDDGGHDKQLVAFISAESQSAPSSSELRRFIAELLPSHMVPDRFVELGVLPLNPNGKVDRHALREMLSDDRRSSTDEIVALATSVEQTEFLTPTEDILEQIWLGLLDIEQIGLHDDFFELGGHSLLATRLISRVRRVFALELPLSLLFESPTIAGLGDYIDGVLRSQAGLEVAAVLPLAPRTVACRLTAPLSFAQQRLWFLYQVDPEDSGYNMHSVHRLGGGVDLRRLERAWLEIVRRHEVLRTTFAVGEDGSPHQKISPARDEALPRVDLRGLQQVDRQAESLKVGGWVASTPFDLARGPLTRPCLVSLGSDEYIFALTFHHIIFDGWSLGVFHSELTTLYRALGAARVSPLDELKIQYADFAVWQRQWLADEVLEKQLNYWRHQLADLSHLELLTDRPRPPIQSSDGAVHRLTLPMGVGEQMRLLSVRQGTSHFITLVSALIALLHRLTGQKDIALGSVIANRNRHEVEELIGFFANAMVLRGDVSPVPVAEGSSACREPTFVDLLRRVREAALGAYTHQDVPFERLVDELLPDRDMSRHPLFQVTLSYQNSLDMAPMLPELDIEPVDLEITTARFDLECHLWDDGEELQGALIYNRSLFDPSRIQRLARQFNLLLPGLLTSPESSLKALPLMSPEERHQLLVAWNDTARMEVEGSCVHDRVAEWGEQNPMAVAVVSEDPEAGPARAMSYGELNQRSNQLARRLRTMGVGPEVLVAVCMDRSPDFVVSVLGILKAGGAYLPLDPSQPAERISWMLADAGVRRPRMVVVTQKCWQETLPLAQNGRQLVCLDNDWASIGQLPSDAIESGTRPEHLAYIIYTSGSTGRPKGTELTHSSLSNLVNWHRHAYGLTSNDRSSMVAAPGFDASVWEIWPYLCSGASLHLPTADTVRSPDLLLAWLEAERISLSFLPTPLAEAVLALPDLSAKRTALRVLLTGGDRLRRRAAPGQPWHLVNNYGPTEGTVVATSGQVVTEGVSSEDDPVLPSIGRPISNIEVYLLDKSLQSVPLGAAGQLAIGGRSLARGYSNRRGQTAGRFVPSPFDSKPGARLYLTGDLSRFRYQGSVEFLGRQDQQVKIRGFRIELGEIEATLGSHSDIREAVVLARTDPEGNDPADSLVAYCTSPSEPAPSQEELQQFLARQLPEYMVPRVVVFLLSMPLNRSGKVDRRALAALPLPTLASSQSTIERDDSSWTPTERQLAAIFEDVLDEPRVDLEDDFFVLGGHSLLATQVISRVRKVFDVEVVPHAFFESATVGQIAAIIDADLEELGHQSVEGPVRVSRDQPLQLSFAQHRLWFLHNLEPDSHIYNLPVAFRLGGELQGAALQASLQEIVRRHETLRTRFPKRQGQPVQQVEEGFLLELPEVDVSRTDSRNLVQALVKRESLRAFDLDSGPVIRCLLIRCQADDHILVVTMHHIASDGWSIGIFFRELAELYSAYCSGRLSRLAEPPIQYVDFAHWHRHQLGKEGLQNQLAYWEQRLAGAPPILGIPTDRPRQAVAGHRGALSRDLWSREIQESLNAFANDVDVTLFMALLAAFQAVLSRYADEADVVVGTPIANRNRIETEQLIGCFVNTLVMRTDFSGAPDFLELVEQVRQRSLEAFANQDVPFDQVVEALQPERNLGHSPIFQVMFALQNTSVQELALLDLRVEPVEDVGLDESKFDLSLIMFEGQDGLELGVEYNRDLFDASSVQRLLIHLRSFVVQVLMNPRQQIGDLAILNSSERHQILNEWNDATAITRREASIPALFERQVVSRPQAIALVFGDEQVSYHELDRRANQLARYIRASTVEPEELVGVCVERSVAMVVALLGILKAGCAYVPLDPDSPPERLAFLIADAGVSTVLTEVRWLAALPANGPNVVCVDRDRGLIGSCSSTAPSDVVAADRMANVIYTSGSTGTPKGVALVHRGVGCLVLGTNYLDATPGDRMSQGSSLSFDAATFEVWGALLNGATLVGIPREILISPVALARHIRSQKISRLFLTTAVFHQLASQQPEALRSVESVFIGGEAADPSLVRRVLEVGAPGRLFNLYGPTENTVVSTRFRVTSVASEAVTVPIGYSISASDARVLDRRLRPAPIGVAGELFVGGGGLARGYLNRPGMTAERFVPSTFGAPGARHYGTGDVVRLGWEGAIEFLGRRDHQVKIRGFRVELGEIESVLVAQPEVSAAAVLVHATTEAPHVQRLVAYVVADSDAAAEVPSVVELRRQLGRQLPDYMVPAAVVWLDDLPLNSNGKVDRRGLPSPESALRSPDLPYLAPETGTQQVIADVWRRALGIERVGLDDPFFELGGNSLLLAKVAGDLEAELSQKVPLVAMFHHPTVRALAQHLEEKADVGDFEEVETVRRIEDQAKVRRQQMRAKRRRRRDQRQ